MAAVHCSCGAVLVDEVADEDVEVGGEHFRFARSTDFIACPDCGHLHRADDLREGIVGGTSEAEEALEALRELAMDDPADDPGRPLGRTPSED